MAKEGNTEPAAAIFYNDQKPDKIFYPGWKWTDGKSRRLQILTNAVKNSADYIDVEYSVSKDIIKKLINRIISIIKFKNQIKVM